MFLFLSVLLLSACAIMVPVSADILGGSDRLIHATGTGSVIGTPDRAQISLGIETQNADVKVAQQDNAARMTLVTGALTAAGIPKDAFKTTGYTIYPVYDMSDKTAADQKIVAYRVTNTLTVTLHDVNRTGDVIDIAVANGANEANSIQFMLSDEQAQVLRTEALKEAVDRAGADAQTTASALHVGLGSVKDVEISQGYTPVLYQNYAVDTKSAGAVPTPVSAGDVTVTATVTVTYLIL